MPALPHNRDYQTDDRDIVDYDFWELPDITSTCRGPQVDLAFPYFSCIGAAQTFGRFVEQPYPTLLAQMLGMQALNLGFAGAGPKFFLDQPKFFDVINKGKFCVVQMCSGRSIDNSVFETDQHQGGKVRFRDKTLRKSDRFLLAEYVYREYLDTAPVEALQALRVEIRKRYVEVTKQLLEKITVPKVLLYFSRRTPHYKEGIIRWWEEYWGDFPHFVNGDVIEALIKDSDVCYVEVVSDRGMPQPLFHRQTGEPFLMWNEAQFPKVKFRYHNNYYPSPEMHQDVAAAVKKALMENLLPLETQALMPREREEKTNGRHLKTVTGREERTGMKKVIVEILTPGGSLLQCFIDRVLPSAVVAPSQAFTLSGVILDETAPIAAIRVVGGDGQPVACSVSLAIDSPVIGGRYPRIGHAGKARFAIRGLSAQALQGPCAIEAVLANQSAITVARLRFVDVTRVLTEEERIPTKRSALSVLRQNGLAVGTVLDVGVQHQTKELMAIFPDRKHLLFEPVEESYPYIERNYAALDYELVKAAASNRDGEGVLEVRSRVAGSPFLTSTVVSPSGAVPSPGMLTTATRKIPEITLDSFLAAKDYVTPFLLKLDVDGNELEVLAGARQTLRKTSCVIVEVSLFNIFERGQFLVNEGFVLWDIVDLGYYRDNLFHADLIFLSAEEKAKPPFSPWRKLPLDERRIITFLH